MVFYLKHLSCFPTVFEFRLFVQIQRFFLFNASGGSSFRGKVFSSQYNRWSEEDLIKGNEQLTKVSKKVTNFK